MLASQHIHRHSQIRNQFIVLNNDSNEMFNARHSPLLSLNETLKTITTDLWFGMTTSEVGQTTDFFCEVKFHRTLRKLQEPRTLSMQWLSSSTGTTM